MPLRLTSSYLYRLIIREKYRPCQKKKNFERLPEKKIDIDEKRMKEEEGGKVRRYVRARLKLVLIRMLCTARAALGWTFQGRLQKLIIFSS